MITCIIATGLLVLPFCAIVDAKRKYAKQHVFTCTGSYIMAAKKTKSVTDASAPTQAAKAPKAKAAKKTFVPAVTEIDATTHYLANGGSKQVLARACMVACDNHVGQAAVLFDLCGGLTRKSTCKGAIKGNTQHTSYVAWSVKEKQAHLTNHKTWQAAQEEAKRLRKVRASDVEKGLAFYQ